MSAATGTERVLALGAGIVMEAVRMEVKERYPRLMPTLYSGVMATGPRPFGTLDAMWVVFQPLTNNRTLAINGEFVFLCFLLRRVCGHPPCRGPGLPEMDVDRAGRLPSRLHGRRDHAIILLS